MQDNTVSFTLKSEEKILYQPGDLVGDSYVLLDMLAKGGMGVVYRARHVQLDKIFALKLLAPMQMTDVNWKRFELEARTLAKLQHPNVVQIYNMGIDRKGCPYYVMELLDGISISDALAGVDLDNNSVSAFVADSNQYVGGPLPLNQFVQCFADVCKALSFAHDKNIVHRDIKPSNLMLINSALPVKLTKVVDFGIARLVGPEELSSQGLTLPGEVFGSPLYMSPEQTMGQPISKATDVYSLGCTMFEIFTGKPPFKGKSAFDTMLMHQTAPVPQIVRPGCDPEILDMVEDIIVQCMAKKPEQRFADAGDILSSLDDVAMLVHGQPPGSRTAKISSKSIAQSRTANNYFSDGADSGQTEAQENTRGQLGISGRLIAVGAVITTLLMSGVVALMVPSLFSQILPAGSLRSSSLGPGKIADTAKPVGARLASEYVSPISKPLPPIRTLSKAELPDVEAPPDATWLHSDAPISRVDLVNHKRWRTFSFPAAPVGRLCFGDEPKIDARGEIKKDARIPFQFLAGEKLNDHSDIYSRFDNEALSFLEIKNVTRPPDMKILSRWKNLDGLAFIECYLPPSWVAELSRLKGLYDLILVHTDLDADSLKKSGLMQSISRIRLDRVDNSSQIMALTANSKKLNSVTFKSIKFSPADSKVIASWQPLREFFVRDCTCTGAVLQQLKSGKDKLAVDIRGSTFQPGDLESLARLSNLLNVRFVEGSLSPSLIRRIQSRNPGVKLQVEESPLKDNF